MPTIPQPRISPFAQIPAGPYGADQAVRAALSGDQRAVYNANAAILTAMRASSEGESHAAANKLDAYFSSLPPVVQQAMAVNYRDNPNLVTAAAEGGYSQAANFTGELVRRGITSGIQDRVKKELAGINAPLDYAPSNQPLSVADLPPGPGDTSATDTPAVTQLAATDQPAATQSAGGDGGAAMARPTLTQVLGQIRQNESVNTANALSAKLGYTVSPYSLTPQQNSRYYVKGPNHSEASGAYQFQPATWREWTRFSGIGTEYSEAYLAPPSVQDAVAAYAAIHGPGVNSTALWGASAPKGGYPSFTIDKTPPALAAAATPLALAATDPAATGSPQDQAAAASAAASTGGLDPKLANVVRAAGLDPSEYGPGGISVPAQQPETYARALSRQAYTDPAAALTQFLTDTAAAPPPTQGAASGISSLGDDSPAADAVRTVNLLGAANPTQNPWDPTGVVGTWATDPANVGGTPSHFDRSTGVTRPEFTTPDTPTAPAAAPGYGQMTSDYVQTTPYGQVKRGLASEFNAIFNPPPAAALKDPTTGWLGAINAANAARIPAALSATGQDEAYSSGAFGPTARPGTPMLRQGMTGPDVANLQQQMVSAGFLQPGQFTPGRFDNATRLATRQVEIANAGTAGIYSPRTGAYQTFDPGYAGPRVQLALTNTLANQAANMDPRTLSYLREQAAAGTPPDLSFPARPDDLMRQTPSDLSFPARPDDLMPKGSDATTPSTLSFPARPDDLMRMSPIDVAGAASTPLVVAPPGMESMVGTPGSNVLNTPSGAPSPPIKFATPAALPNRNFTESDPNTSIQQEISDIISGARNFVGGIVNSVIPGPFAFPDLSRYPSTVDRRWSFDPVTDQRVDISNPGVLAQPGQGANAALGVVPGILPSRQMSTPNFDAGTFNSPDAANAAILGNMHGFGPALDRPMGTLGYMLSPSGFSADVGAGVGTYLGTDAGGLAADLMNPTIAAGQFGGGGTQLYSPSADTGYSGIGVGGAGGFGERPSSATADLGGGGSGGFGNWGSSMGWGGGDGGGGGVVSAGIGSGSYGADYSSQDQSMSDDQSAGG